MCDVWLVCTPPISCIVIDQRGMPRVTIYVLLCTTSWHAVRMDGEHACDVCVILVYRCQTCCKPAKQQTATHETRSIIRVLQCLHCHTGRTTVCCSTSICSTRSVAAHHIPQPPPNSSAATHFALDTPPALRGIEPSRPLGTAAMATSPPH